MKKKLLVFAALMLLALACASVAFAKDVPDGAVVTRGELDEITSVAGFPIVDLVLEWPETCTEAGRVRVKCQLPEDTVDYHLYIEPHPHTMSSTVDPEWGRVIEPATCSSEGKAIDVCVCPYPWCDCDYEDPDHIRTIEKKPHEYDMSGHAWYNGHAEMVKAPSCYEGGEGKAWLTCVYCGERMPEQEDDSHLCNIWKIPHDWSDWREDEPSTCLEYGKASRTCLRCSYLQYLDEDHPVLDQGTAITIADVLPLRNPDWNTSLDDNVYSRQFDLDNDLKAQGFEYEIKKNWLKDCYTREITYTCPYCEGTEHDDFTVTLVKPATIAHVWADEPDADDSVPATCTEDGYDIYYCIYDAKYWGGAATTTTGVPTHGHDEKDQYYRVEVPALGHDWTEWFPADVYEKDGETYLVSFRRCNVCWASEQKTEKYTEPEVKQGLVKDDDGVWRYYIDGEVATDVTELIPFQGAEFWVVNGVVPVNANGLVICPDGKAWFLAYGMVQRVTDWAEYNGEWFIIKNGQLDKVTGLMPYNGGWFAVESGRKLHVDGLWQDPNTGVWVYMIDGMLWDYTGPAEYDGHTFDVVHGYLAD